MLLFRKSSACICIISQKLAFIMKVERGKMPNLKIALISILLFSVSLFTQTGENDELAADLSEQEYMPYKAKDMHQTVLEFGEGKLESLKLTDNGIPRSIWGDLDKEITSGDKLDKCYQFFELHKELLEIQNPREEIKFRVHVNNTFRFDQYYKGIKTEGTHSIHFDLKGGDNIVGYTASPDPEAYSVDVNYTISPAQAQSTAVDTCKVLHPDEKISSSSLPELLIKKKDNSDKLVWKVVVNRGEYDLAFYHCFVDASTGDIISLTEAIHRNR